VAVETIAGTAPASHSFLVSDRGGRSLCTFNPMDSSQRRQLVEYYRSDVQQLEVMLGRAAPWEEFHGALD
jgi:hypothetical protein